MTAYQTMNISAKPTRMLKKRDAAVYCGLSVQRFDQACPVQPVEFSSGDLRFDVQDLDAWIDSMKPGTTSQLHNEIIDRLE